MGLHFRSIWLLTEMFFFLSSFYGLYRMSQKSLCTVDDESAESPCKLTQTHFSYLPDSPDSAVGIAAGYELDDRDVGIRVPSGSIFLFMPSRPALGPTQPPIQWVPGALSLGVKRPGREAHHSPPVSAEVKKTCVYTSTPHMSSWRRA
jgi:hypothetical protein